MKAKAIRELKQHAEAMVSAGHKVLSILAAMEYDEDGPNAMEEADAKREAYLRLVKKVAEGGTLGQFGKDWKTIKDFGKTFGEFNEDVEDHKAMGFETSLTQQYAELLEQAAKGRSVRGTNQFKALLRGLAITTETFKRDLAKVKAGYTVERFANGVAKVSKEDEDEIAELSHNALKKFHKSRKDFRHDVKPTSKRKKGKA